MSQNLRFEPFTLDLESGDLRREGRPIKLHPQPAQLLVLLAKRAGMVVGREEIQKALWSDDTIVDFDTSINSCIRQIRTALEDDAEKPHYIETVPKRGYRFIGVKTRDHKWLRWAAAVSLALAAISSWIYLTSPEPEAPPFRVSPLTAYPGLERDPAVSPDGNQVAFVWNGGGDGLYHLYVQLIDGDQPLQQSAVSKMNLETGEVSDLTCFGRESGFCFGATVSPDGQWLMHSISEPAKADLMVVENFE